MLYIKYYLWGFIPKYRIATNKEVRDYVLTTMSTDSELIKRIKGYTL